MTNIEYYFPRGDGAIMAHFARMTFAASALWMFGYVRKSDGGYAQVMRYGTVPEVYLGLTPAG